MADTKISALTGVASVASANEFGVNEAAVSKKATAAQIKTFVTTAPVFAAGTSAVNTAPKLTSGTLNTTAEAGALEFDGDAAYQTNNTTSGRTIMPGHFLYRLTADQGLVGAAIADFFTATSSFATVTNGIYIINYHLFFTKTTSGTITWTLTNTQTYTNLNLESWASTIGGIGTDANYNYKAIEGATAAATALPVTGSLTGGTQAYTRIRALALCGTAGNIRLRITQSAGTVTARRGCYYTVQQLAAASNVGILVA